MIFTCTPPQLYLLKVDYRNVYYKHTVGKKKRFNRYYYFLKIDINRKYETKRNCFMIKLSFLILPLISPIYFFFIN